MSIPKSSVHPSVGWMDEFIVRLSVWPIYRSQNRSENCVLWLVNRGCHSSSENQNFSEMVKAGIANGCVPWWRGSDSLS